MIKSVHALGAGVLTALPRRRSGIWPKRPSKEERYRSGSGGRGTVMGRRRDKVKYRHFFFAISMCYYFQHQEISTSCVRVLIDQMTMYDTARPLFYDLPCEAKKNCHVLFLQYLYQTYLHSDNFRHTYTTINLLSPVYFTFFIKSKTGNPVSYTHLTLPTKRIV